MPFSPLAKVAKGERITSSMDIVDYFGEKKRLNQIDVEAVKRYVKFMNTEATAKKGNPYSKTTVFFIVDRVPIQAQFPHFRVWPVRWASAPRASTILCGGGPAAPARNGCVLCMTHLPTHLQTPRYGI